MDVRVSAAVLAEQLAKHPGWETSGKIEWRAAPGYTMPIMGVRVWDGSHDSDTLAHGTSTLDAPSPDAGVELWVCAPDAAEALVRSGHFVAVVLGDEGEIGQVADKLFSVGSGNSEVLVTRCLGGVTGLANGLLQAKEELDAWDGRMTDSIVRRRPLAETLSIGAEQLANPVAVFDEASGLVSYAGDLTDGYEGTIWEDVLDRGWAPSSYFSMDESSQFAAGLADPGTPTLVRAHRCPGHQNLALGMMEGGQLLGIVAQVDLRAPFDAAQIELVMHLRDRLTEVFRTTFAGRHHTSPVGHTLRLLLQGDDVDESIARYQLERRCWHTGDAYCLTAIPLPDKVRGPYSEPFSTEAAALRPGSVTIEHEGHLVVLAHLDPKDPRGSRRDFVEALRNRRGNEMPCGVSDEFAFMRARDAWLQALAALREGNGNGRGGVSTFGDVFVPYLLHRGGQSLPLGVAAHPAAIAMAAEDHGDELLSCVYAYVMSGRNISRAARALYMHRNTLEYRLRGVRERWGLDMDDMEEDELLRLALSCRLLVQRGLEA